MTALDIDREATTFKRATTCVSIGALALLVSACTAPVTIGPAFREPPGLTAKAGATRVGGASPECRLQIAEIVDARRSPEILGIVGRAVKAPDDRAAWLRSVLAGLSRRGFTIDFGGAQSAATRPLVVRATLVSAWVTETSVNKNANVVWRIVVARANAPSVSKDYRGGVAALNWTDGPKELRALVDDAFAKSLDAMAPDLHGLCGG